MPSDRRRILELALESLEGKKRELDREIADITRELRGKTAKTALVLAPGAGPFRKRPRFSKEERLRRSRRMKAYWESWRKKQAR